MFKSVRRTDAASYPKDETGAAVLTEAVRQADIIHISLAGMTAIVLLLLIALAMPAFGYAPIKHISVIVIVALTAFVGIGVLYFMNFRVHEHVASQARLTEVLVNSLGQGFLVFDHSGVCGTVYSQACLDLLEVVPTGKSIADILRIPQDQRDDFKDWLDVLYMPNHALSFEDVVKFLPQYFDHSQDRRISLVYRPIRGKDNVLVRVVMIATDQTEEYAAQQLAKRQQAYAEMICRIFKERNRFHATLTHLNDFVSAARAPGVTMAAAPEFLRQLHTLKATVKHFNLIEMNDIVSAAEHDLRDPLITDDAAFLKQLEQTTEQIAAGLANVLKDIKDLLGSDINFSGHMREIDEDVLYNFAQDLKNSDADPSLLLRYLICIAAVPIRECFRSFEHELIELASIMGKQASPIRYVGSNPRILTRPIYDFLFSLTHLSRNIADHGIEAPITRMGRGKNAAGQVTIRSEIEVDQTGEWLRLTISDDGAGIDPSRVRHKLSAIDPEGEWRLEDDQTVIQRIFSWGFTTRDGVTDISGRGVGMEAIEREVKLLGGTIRVTSELYQGATFDIRIPYKMDLVNPQA